MCAECHAPTLLGNDGKGDVPEFRRKFKSVVVPPLAGARFMQKWGPQTTKDLYTRIQGVTRLDEETYLDLVAYILHRTEQLCTGRHAAFDARHSG